MGDIDVLRGALMLEVGSVKSDIHVSMIKFIALESRHVDYFSEGSAHFVVSVLIIHVVSQITVLEEVVVSLNLIKVKVPEK